MFKTQTHHKLLAIGLFISVASFFLLSGKSSAATITVGVGLDETTTNSSCSLSEAITNINDQAATYPDCAAGDGNNDTITISAGTITLTASLQPVTQPATIQGAGMGQSVIDGDGLYSAIINNTNLNISSLKVTGFAGFGIYSQDNNIALDRVEIDGSGSVFSTGPNSGAYGVLIVNRNPSVVDVSISNLYIHDMVSTTTNLFPLLITTGRDTPGSTGDLRATVSNVTIASISGEGNVFAFLAAAGMNSFGYGTGSTYLDASNVTISNIHSSAGPAAGIIVGAITPEDRETTGVIKNSTITSISGLPNPLLGGKSGAGLIALTGGFVDGISNVVNLAMQNILIANTGNSCVATDASGLLGSNATGTYNLTSTGGNLSDDSSCASYFTQPTDQNNVAGLGASLAALADNGGFVPTMALKEGSPAIDSGITVAGLTTDARGISRPQGTAYDSGAYESPYSKPATPTLAKSGQNIAIALAPALAMIWVGLGLKKRSVYRAR